MGGHDGKTDILSPDPRGGSLNFLLEVNHDRYFTNKAKHQEIREEGH